MCRAINKRYRYPPQLIDISILPDNVFDLKGGAFYSLVAELTSDDIEDLLKLQRISSVRCFLNTNPLTLLDLQTDDQSVIELQARLSYRSADGKIVVLAGIIADIFYLKQLFKLVLVEQDKKKINHDNSTTTAERPSSNINKRTTTNRISTVRSKNIEFSTDDHRRYINQQIASWWIGNRDNYDLDNHLLQETDDYELIINRDSTIIKCSCNQNIRLPLPAGRKYYQLSNFYKHLKGNDQCNVISKKCSTSEADDDAESFKNIPAALPSRRLTDVVETNEEQRLKQFADDSSSSFPKAKSSRRKW